MATTFVTYLMKLQFRVSKGERYVTYLHCSREGNKRFLTQGRSTADRFSKDSRIEAVKAKLEYVNENMLGGEMSFDVAVVLARKMRKAKDPSRMSDWSIRRTIAGVVADALKN